MNLEKIKGCRSILLGLYILGLLGCSDSNVEPRWGESKGVGGEFTTMNECKQAIDNTAEAYGYKYAPEPHLEEPDYYSVKLLDKTTGVVTGYLAVCNEKKDIYYATFEIPPEK